ncbi:hypothetical protein QUB63_05710 [Microcoleus sp. ARI1-B5]
MIKLDYIGIIYAIVAEILTLKQFGKNQAKNINIPPRHIKTFR